MRKNFNILMVILLIVFFSFNVVLAESNEDIKGKITVWSWNIAAKGLNDILPGFNEKYPNVEVEVKEMGFDDVHQKLLMSLTARKGFPDVVSIEDRQVQKYAGRGLMELSKMGSVYEDDFVAFKWDQVTKNGKLYALPWDSAPAGVFYRRDVFDRYGLNPDNIETWDDFIEFGKTIKAKSNGEVTMLNFQTSAVGEFHQMVAWSIGGGIFDKEGEIIVNSPENIKAYQVLKKMVDAGIVSDIANWGPAWYGSMKNGTMATYLQGVWLGGTLRYQAPETSGKWGVFRIPAVEEGGTRASNVGGSALAIAQFTKNKEAAWAFVEYAMATKEGQLKMYQTQDLFPAYKPTFKTAFFQEPVDFYGEQNVRELFAEIAVEIPEYYYTNDYSQAISLLETGLFEAFSEKKTIEQALEETSRKIVEKTGRKLAK